MTQFGAEFREKYFPQVPKDVTPVNHGSYGLTPKPVLDFLNELNHEQEEYPDEFYLLTAKNKYIAQLKALGKFLNVDYHNLALLPNATMSVNAVLRSIPWDLKNDKVLIHSSTYGGCANSVKFVHDSLGLQYDIIDLQYPLEDKDVIAKFEEKLTKNNYKLCMFDTVCSMPGVRLPYEELIKACKKYDTWTLIDAAHGAGLVDMGFLHKLKPDFVTSNLHKWLCAPKSTSFLYVDPKHHKTIQTFPISWSYALNSTELTKEMEENLLIEKFWFSGTINYTSGFCIEKAIQFRKEICGGEEKINKYQADLQKEAIDIVLREFGTGAKLLDNSTHTVSVAGMFNISFPKNERNTKFIEHLTESFAAYRKFKVKCETKMVVDHKAFAPFIAHNNELWIRFSVNIYNTAADYERSAKLIKQTIEECIEDELK
ncbi:hypothetical protein MOUN0_K09890 [Monosporozyma unispora]|nr:hypothetical protein C6P44_000718 [Kazachstania unispora]